LRHDGGVRDAKAINVTDAQTWINDGEGVCFDVTHFAGSDRVVDCVSPRPNIINQFLIIIGVARVERFASKVVESGSAQFCALKQLFKIAWVLEESWINQRRMRWVSARKRDGPTAFGAQDADMCTKSAPEMNLSAVIIKDTSDHVNLNIWGWL
jgi:hypothetical protein